jgi:hypothetical protein
MNVEIGAEAALFPEKEYINGIAVAVYGALHDTESCLAWLVIADFDHIMLSGHQWWASILT